MALGKDAVSASVVIPLFQKEAYVDRALHSVLGQTHKHLEIIVVDDGSTDGGPDAAAATGDPRVTVLRQPHLGAGAARNRGWRSARSPLVAFLDADDEWRPRFLEETLALIGQTPELVAVFANAAVTGSGPLLRDVRSTNGVVSNYFETVLQNGGVGMCSSSVLIRRSVLESSGGFPEDVPSGEDIDTWARIAWTGPLGYVAECLAEYHTEARMRAPRDPKAYPAFLRSFRTWSRDDKIPALLLPASRRLANVTLADHCMELAHVGDGNRARSLIREGWLGGPPRRYFLKALAWSFAPSALLRRLRRVRALIGTHETATIARLGRTS